MSRADVPDPCRCPSLAHGRSAVGFVKQLGPSHEPTVGPHELHGLAGTPPREGIGVGSDERPGIAALAYQEL
jgi:hypothetical protein